MTQRLDFCLCLIASVANEAGNTMEIHALGHGAQVFEAFGLWQDSCGGKRLCYTPAADAGRG